MQSKYSSDYRSLITSLKLVSIVNTRVNYYRDASCSEIRQLASKDVGILRAAFTPEYDLQEDLLGVPVAYKFEVKSEKGVLASFEFQYEVVFQVLDADTVSDKLKIEEIRKFFLGYQMEKFVWSYLRSAFAEACNRLGIQSFILPMKQ